MDKTQSDFVLLRIHNKTLFSVYCESPTEFSLNNVLSWTQFILTRFVRWGYCQQEFIVITTTPNTGRTRVSPNLPIITSQDPRILYRRWFPTDSRISLKLVQLIPNTGLWWEYELAGGIDTPPYKILIFPLDFRVGDDFH